MLTAQYIKIYFLQIIRNKSAFFFTIIFPSILLLLYLRHVPSTLQAELTIYVAMANYAVQCAMFQALGMSVAIDKERGWNRYLRILPSLTYHVVLGRIITMFIVALISLFLVLMVGVCTLPIQLEIKAIFELILISLSGAIPFGLLAVGLGQLITATSARSIFVLSNILLFFSGFAWPDDGFFSLFKNYILNYQWLLLSCDLIIKKTLNYGCIIGIVIYSFIFYYLIVLSNRIMIEYGEENRNADKIPDRKK